MGLVRANHRKVNYHSVSHLKFAHGIATASVCYSNILYTPISNNHRYLGSRILNLDFSTLSYVGISNSGLGFTWRS